MTGADEEISDFSYRPTGFCSPAENFEEDRIDLNKVLIPNGAQSYCVRLLSDAMEPDIAADSLLIIDRKAGYASGSVVACRVGSDILLAVYRNDEDGRITLEFTNPDYPPLQIDENTDFEVWGAVVWSIKNHGRHRAGRLQ